MKSPPKKKYPTEKRSEQNTVYSLPNNAGKTTLYYNTLKFTMQQKWWYRNIYDDNEKCRQENCFLISFFIINSVVICIKSPKQLWFRTFLPRYLNRCAFCCGEGTWTTRPYIRPKRNYLEYVTTDRNGCKEYKCKTDRCENCLQREMYIQTHKYWWVCLCSETPYVSV